MAVDPVTGGLIGWICGKLANKGLKYLLQSSEFKREINKAVKKWGKSMRGDKDVDPSVLFGVIEGVDDSEGEHYLAIQEKLLKRQWPDKKQWHNAFVERWKYVRAEVEEPQAFFRLDESQASVELNRLAEAVYGVCKENDAIFKSAVIDKLDGLEGYVREHLTGQREIEIEGFKLSLSKLPTTGHELFGRKEEIETLDEAWQDEHTNILSFVAWGGVGKTALVNHWLGQMGLANWRGAERVYGWSFYSQGTKEERQVSADEFFEDTLKWFGYEGEPLKNSWDKGKRLAELVRMHRTLLILDGVEPLQYPPGPMQGQLKDKGLQALLKELSRSNPGLCIITTREKIEDLENIDEPALKRVFLENLSVEAGVKLLKNLGVKKGTDKELKKAVGEFSCHALALNLLGTYLATVHDGEIRKRDLVPHLTDEEEQGGHAKRVMESYERWLKDKPELDVLYLMGLFDRPAPGGAIAELRAEPAIEGLTDRLQGLSEAKWQYTVKHLRDLRLLGERDESEPDKLDCHPLVREHFGQKLQESNPEAWREAHGRLYEYYKNVPKKELPDTLTEMEPLFAAVSHGCQAGRHQETLDDVFWGRIRRRNLAYSVKKLGAIGADLASLSGFFEKPWSKPVRSLTAQAKAAILNFAGFALRALGRLTEAAEPLQGNLQAYIKQKNWSFAAIAAGNLSELYLTLGDVEKAMDYARRSYDFSEQSDVMLAKFHGYGDSGGALHQSGNLKKSEEYFKRLESLQKKEEPGYPYLYSARGFRYCDLLLSAGQYKEVQKRANDTIKIAQRNNWLLAIAQDKLSLGRAYLIQASLERSSDYVKAADSLNQAVDGLREAGRQDYLPRALFAQAELFRYQKRWEKAWADLEEAKEIAERGQMNLYMADYHLEAARLCLAQGERLGQVCEHFEEAAKRIEDMGYHRRDPEVLLIQAELELAEGKKSTTRKTLKAAERKINEMGCHRWDIEVERLQELLKKATKAK